MHSNTSDNTCKELIRQKKRGNARQKYSLDLLHTLFTIIQNIITPPHTVRSALSALYPLKKTRQRGTLLSCQLMINGSASHLHRHHHNVPRLTTHTHYLIVQKVATAGPQGPFDIVRTFTLPVIWPFWPFKTSSLVHLCLSAYPS